MSVVLFGKHPAYGDFLTHGMDTAQSGRLDAWLEDILPSLRSHLNSDWETIWDSAPVLNAWIGPEVIGLPLMGVFVPSRDKVGRRYPLIMGLTGVVTPPPLHPAHDPAPFHALAAYVAGLDTSENGTPAIEKIITGFEAPELQGAVYKEGQDSAIWAHREDGNLGRLFQDAIAVDADKAQLNRSHWWHAAVPGRYAGWLGVNGLPDMLAMRWLLAERSTTRGKNEDG